MTKNLKQKENSPNAALEENERLATLTPMAIALELAEEGFSVFPANRAKDADGKSIESIDKTPKLPGNWKEHATRDPEKIKQLFADTTRKDTYVAAHLRDHVAIDLDTYKPGEDQIIDRLLNEDTRIHRTQNGGFHVLFSDPGNEWGNSAASFPKNVDVRGHNGYTIMPNGEDYLFENLNETRSTPDYVKERLAVSDKVEGSFTASPAAIAALERASSTQQNDRFKAIVEKVYYDQGDAGSWHDSARDLDAIMASAGFDQQTRFKLLETAATQLSVASPTERRRRRFQKAKPEIGRLVLGSEAKFKSASTSDLKIRSLVSAMADHWPLSYVVSGFIARNKLYCCTAPKGSNKTTLAMHLAISVAGRLEFAERMPVHKRARVLFMAGENPDDVLMRFKAIVWKLELPASVLDNIDILERSMDIAEDVDALLQVAEGKEYGLVIIDTAQAYSPLNEDSNANTAMLKYARGIRRLTKLGSPAIFIMAHPTKAEARNRKEFEPYGAGSFSNEIDGLCSLKQDGKVVTLMKNAKWRGRNWEEVSFKSEIIEDCPSLKENTIDEDGKEHIEQDTAPMLLPLSEEERKEAEGQSPVYARLTENQQRVFDAVVALTLINETAPTREEIVGHLLPQWAGESPDKTKRQSIGRTLHTLVRKKVVGQRGEEYYAKGGNSEAGGQGSNATE